VKAEAKLLIKGGRVIDPANNIDDVRDILVENGKICKIAKNIPENSSKIIEAKDKIVLPALVDMHVHLREPGREDKETVASGTAAAAKGGVASLLAMPNTDPAMDSAENLKLLAGIIKSTAAVNVFIAGAITKGREGRELVDIAKLKKAGAIVITDDGNSLDSDVLMSKALKEARQQGILVLCHSQDKKLSCGGAVNLGFTSTRMGLKGISNASEYQRVERDIRLAKAAKAPVHITHISCAESVRIIAQAKKQGVAVTCDTCPHYFSFDEEAVLGYDTNFKMNPPLRSKADVAAIKQGLKSGVIDAIASDHAPHTENEKDIEFEQAEFGVTGLETELSAAVTELVHGGLLNWTQLAQKMCLAPAKILDINKGTLGVSRDADMVILDPDKEWAVRAKDFVSQSKNSPFIGKTLKGLVECTICNGKIVYGIYR
jgi:dihydroorotase